MTASGTATELNRQLREVLPPAAFAESVAEYAVDGVLPADAVSPSSQEEVARILALANNLGAAVIPWGGGSHMALGMPPARYDLALDLQRLDRVVEYELADLTATVEAGVRLANLQMRLMERGQWLPLDPPGGAIATIGGILAVNASGPARIAHGTARDLVIGMTVATAEGQIVKSGGRVVKNVAGYDMAKLHIGALGTLGIVLQVSLKVAPLPAVMETITGEAGRLEDLTEAAKAATDRGLAINGLLLSNDSDGRWRLSARLAGSHAGVERSKRELTTLLAQAESISDPEASAVFWLDLTSSQRASSLDGVVCKVASAPAKLPALIGEAAAPGARIIAYPATGVAYLRWQAKVEAEALRRLRDLCIAAQGAFVIEHAPVALKREIDVWGPPRGDFRLMQRLKDEMDPKGILSPGRYLGGI